MDPTNDELLFLRRHAIPTDRVLDVRGMRKIDWQVRAKAEGMLAVIGSPCREARHRLRNRSGHCIQCDPSKLAFEARFSAPGVIYLAWSRSTGLVKIGGAASAMQREASLQGYASIHDWQILSTTPVEGYGRIEEAVRAKLKPSLKPITYRRDGKNQVASEVYSCTVEEATRALGLVLYEILGAVKSP